MECKCCHITRFNTVAIIRIVPEWNVNIVIVVRGATTEFIRIVPEWNVNKEAITFL